MLRKIFFVWVLLILIHGCKFTVTMNEAYEAEKAKHEAVQAKYESEQAKYDLYNSLIIIGGSASVCALAFGGIFGLMILGDRMRRKRELEVMYYLSNLRLRNRTDYECFTADRGEVINYEIT